jgi:hypothetical protein
VPGQTTTITGRRFAPNSILQANLFSAPVLLATFKSDASGNYSATVTIPADTALGSHQIVVSGPGANGGTNNSVGSLTVVAPNAAPVATAVVAQPNFTG